MIDCAPGATYPYVCCDLHVGIVYLVYPYLDSGSKQLGMSLSRLWSFVRGAPDWHDMWLSNYQVLVL